MGETMDFFAWAKQQGLGLNELASLLKYTDRHIRRIRDGEYPMTTGFHARVIAFMTKDYPDAQFFLDGVSKSWRDSPNNPHDIRGNNNG